MTRPTEHQLAEALKRAVPEPAADGDRAERARARAGRIRRRRWLTVLGAGALAAAAALAVPALIGSGRDDVAPGPAATPSSECDPDCRPATVLEQIRTPLRIRMLAPGDPCPVSPARRFPAGAGFNQPFDALSAGPLAMFGFGSVDGTVFLQDRPRPGRWGELKVIWVFDPPYGGPVLLRGQRIDAPGRLGFVHYIGAQGYTGGSVDDAAHRQVFYLRSGLTGAGSTDVETYPGGVYVKGPGCYAVQVDGLGFSERLVFAVARR